MLVFSHFFSLPRSPHFVYMWIVWFKFEYKLKSFDIIQYTSKLCCVRLCAKAQADMEGRAPKQKWATWANSSAKNKFKNMISDNTASFSFKPFAFLSSAHARKHISREQEDLCALFRKPR